MEGGFMKSLLLKGLLLTVVVVCLSFTPASADFSLYGTWWDTDEADDAAGIGAGWAGGLGEVIDLEFRATWYEELTDEPLEDLFTGATPIETGLTVIPIELGLRFNFARDSTFWNPWFGVGASYYLLDTDTGNIDDEVGYYGSFGAMFGDGEGADFFAEVGYRWSEATVTSFDVDQDNVLDEFDIKLDGPYLNVGVRWRF
jgi:hypothetical protein